MNRQQNEKSIELHLRRLLDEMVLEPERKKIALRAMNKLLHASRVSDIKSLRKAIDGFLGTVLRHSHTSNRNDD
jgi:hypothetical protein